jgi:hypothetical protein
MVHVRYLAPETASSTRAKPPTMPSPADAFPEHTDHPAAWIGDQLTAREDWDQRLGAADIDRASPASTALIASASAGRNLSSPAWQRASKP